MARKKDLRSIQTEDLLMSTLAQLLTEKEINKISIRELTGRAGIHRATFYDHFADIYDLYDRMMDSFFEQLQETIDDDSIVSYEDFYGAIISLLENNKSLGKLVFSSPRIMEKVEKLFIKGCIDTWKEYKIIHETSPEAEFLASCRVNGCIGILKQWMNSECKYPSDMLKSFISDADERIDNTMQPIIRG